MRVELVFPRAPPRSSGRPSRASSSLDGRVLAFLPSSSWGITVNQMVKRTAMRSLAEFALVSMILMMVKMEVEAGSRYVRGIHVPEEGRGARVPNMDGRADRPLRGFRSTSGEAYRGTFRSRAQMSCPCCFLLVATRIQ
jgi:hypothetical protein